MKRTLLIVLCVLVSSVAMNLYAQQFSNPSNSFSQKKPCYITMKGGSKVEATINKLSYKKSQIDELVVKNDEGKKVKVVPEDIDFMYLPQSAYEKMNQASELLNDAKRWKSNTLDNDKIEKGYVYFESTDVIFGKKTIKLLMQVLNPGFCSKVKVYFDPYATETAAVGIGGVTLAGGDAKSYYFKKGNEAAYKLTKRDYKKEFSEIWSDCPALIEKYGNEPKWLDLPMHIVEYSELMK
jgi:hypothetical protein